MSVWATAAVAANRAVSTPTQAMRPSVHVSASASTGFNLVSRKTPEVTMVAAWISAETGVGPAMASGNQTYSGSWADLPAAARRNSTTAKVAVRVPSSPDRVRMSS